MKFEEYRKHDTISLAALIAKREVSAEEVLEVAVARAEQINPVINAIVHTQSTELFYRIKESVPDRAVRRRGAVIQ